MTDARRFPVHHFLSVNNVSPQRFADGLMSEADAEHRHLACESLADELEQNSRAIWTPRTGREDNRVGAKGEDGIDRCAVAASSRHIAAEDLKVLHEVVGERVVVVEHENLHGSHSF